jgi:hypothetical protein
MKGEVRRGSAAITQATESGPVTRVSKADLRAVERERDDLQADLELCLERIEELENDLV